MSNITKIDKWLKTTGMRESTLGLLSCVNPRAIARIRSGKAQIQTLDKVMAYLAKNKAKKP